MPAHEELRLIAKIVDSGELRSVIDAGITLDNFTTPEGHLGFEYIWRYWHDRQTNGNVPTRELFETRHPTLAIPPADRLTLDAVISEFKNHYISERLGVMSEEIADYGDSDPTKVLDMLQQEVDNLTRIRRVSHDIEMSSSMKQAASDYQARKEAGGMPGIPYPWEALNEESGGMKDGEYIVFFGRPKSMKSWLLLHCACHAYNYFNRRILVYTREMPLVEIRDRCICLLLNIPYMAFLKGKLHEYPCPSGRGTLEDRFFELVDALSNDEHICRLETGYDKGLIITSDRDDPRGGGVDGLRQKVKDHGPDAIFLDGLYLMRNDRDKRRSVKWNDQYAISQDMRDLSLDTNRPLVVTTQGNREGKENYEEGTEDVAFADSVGMDCTHLIKVIKKRTQNPEVNELALLIKASRTMNMVGFAVNGCPASDFSQLMRKRVNPENNQVIKDLSGNPLYEPVIFYEPEDAKSMFAKPKKKEERPANFVSSLNQKMFSKARKRARGK